MKHTSGEAVELKLTPIDSSEARQWRSGWKGPEECQTWACSAVARTLLAFAARWPGSGRKSLIRFAARCCTSDTLQLQTSWDRRIVADRGDTYFLRGVCDEPLETAVIARLLRPGMTVLDIGANRGWYTLLMSALVGKQGMVFAFEPNEDALRQLQRNVAANQNSANVAVMNTAVSDRNGTVNFRCEQDDTVSRLDTPSLESCQRVTQVACVRLDEWMNELGIQHVDFIKCDVEGAESQVLRGLAPRISETHRPILLFECIDRNLRRYDSSAEEMVSCVTELGYEVFLLSRRAGTAIPFTSESLEHARNVLCVPPTRVGQTLREVFAEDGVDSQEQATFDA